MIADALANAAGPLVTADGGNLALYALGVINTLLIAVLGFLMNSRESSNRTAQRQMYDAMREVAHDLKALNDAVLGKYATQEKLEDCAGELHRRIDALDEARRSQAHDFNNKLHAFGLDMATFKARDRS